MVIFYSSILGMEILSFVKLVKNGQPPSQPDLLEEMTLKNVYSKNRANLEAFYLVIFIKHKLLPLMSKECRSAGRPSTKLLLMQEGIDPYLVSLILWP